MSDQYTCRKCGASKARNEMHLTPSNGMPTKTCEACWSGSGAAPKAPKPKRPKVERPRLTLQASFGCEVFTDDDGLLHLEQGNDGEKPDEVVLSAQDFLAIVRFVASFDPAVREAAR